MAAAPAQPSAAASSEPPSKPIHSLVLDTGPLIKNDPPASTLLAKAEKLYTLPSVIPEIRDVATRTRVETQLLPFVTLRSPRPASIKFVTGFARRTGDLAVLSRPDIEVLALGYELECERNGGDWRLRNTPGQKGLNGRPNKEKTETQDDAAPEGIAEAQSSTPEAASTSEAPGKDVAVERTIEESVQSLSIGADAAENTTETGTTAASQTEQAPGATEAPEAPEAPEVEQPEVETADEPTAVAEEASDEDDDEDDDDGGWITPSNLKKHQSKDAGTAIPSPSIQKTLQAAVLTSDYAMQNVALRMNLNLVAPSMARITHLKNWVLRCHGCFHICKDMNRQFCPSCGQPTLTRTSCSTDEHGNFRVHLKRNFQWNKRGNVYSVPRPVHGSANGRLPKHAGGQNGWGQNLILSEDQKEYTKATDEQRRARKKDLMDQDYLPSLLTGDRSGGHGKIRVGAGRNVNSKRKH